MSGIAQPQSATYPNATIVNRLSLHLTLLIAFACLGYAEANFLPESSALAVGVGFLILLSLVLEGRWVMSIGLANFLGAIVGGCAGVWVAVKMARPTGLLETLPFPSGMLPYLGPWLMILTPLKLFRPKTLADYWQLHGIGLAAVVLAAALAFDVTFGLLLLLYMLCALWSLVLLHLPSNSNVSSLMTFSLTIRWAGMAALLAFFFFLLLPRPANSAWDLALKPPRMETGFPEDNPLIDLNRTGTLAINREVVMTVEVTDREGRPKSDLTPTQRWRGTALSVYQRGRWMPGTPPLPNVEFDYAPMFEKVSGPISRRPLFRTNAVLPDLGPDSYFITYRPTAKLGHSVFLADPVAVPTERRAPVVTILPDGGQISWFRHSDGSVQPVEPMPVGRGVYRQVTRPPTHVKIGPPLGIEPHPTDLPYSEPVGRLHIWTANLINRLIEDKKLPEEVRTNPDAIGRPRIEYHEAIARALSNHLALSGEYRYTLKLERIDRNLDPVEDFLYNLKRGHCERFASALALMLRSQRIPCQVILGFRGADPAGKGKYEIRQSHAHSWVEVLVRRAAPEVAHEPREGEDAFPRRRTYLHWLALDPTPALEAIPESSGWAGLDWLAPVVGWGQSLFQQFIVGYNADQRKQAVSAISEQFYGIWGAFAKFVSETAESPIGLGLLVSLVGLLCYWLLLQRARRRPKPLPDPLPAMSRLLSVLRQLGCVRAASQTPREFAHAVADRLRTQHALQTVAEVPTRVTESYYRVIYGGEAVNFQDAALLESVEQLQASLKAARFRW